MFLSVVILGRFTTETHAMALLRQDRHAAATYTTPRDVPHGPGYSAVMLDGLREWMGRKGYTAIGEFRGLLAIPVGVDETTRERGDYITALRQANTTYAP
jgi:hypothetical protein